MAPPDYTEHVFASTMWEYRKVKVNRPPGASKYSDVGAPGAPKSRFGFWPLSRLDWTKPVHVTLKYRGGDEGWIEVHARGRKARYPGYVCLLDLFAQITRNQP